MKTTLIASEADPAEGLRLLPRADGRFELVLSTELSGDQVVEYEGFKVLLLGIEYFQILDGKTLDCLNTEDGVILFLR